MRCNAEMCPFWTGMGCACDVMGLEEDERPEPIEE